MSHTFYPDALIYPAAQLTLFRENIHDIEMEMRLRAATCISAQANSVAHFHMIAYST